MSAEEVERAPLTLFMAPGGTKREPGKIIAGSLADFVQGQFADITGYSRNDWKCAVTEDDRMLCSRNEVTVRGPDG